MFNSIFINVKTSKECFFNYYYISSTIILVSKYILYKHNYKNVFVIKQLINVGDSISVVPIVITTCPSNFNTHLFSILHFV